MAEEEYCCCAEGVDVDELISAETEYMVELGILANAGENVGCNFGDLDRLRKAKCAKFGEDTRRGEIGEVAVKDYTGVLKVE